jgi:hypothetical protein
MPNSLGDQPNMRFLDRNKTKSTWVNFMRGHSISYGIYIWSLNFKLLIFSQCNLNIYSVLATLVIYFIQHFNCTDITSHVDYIFVWSDYNKSLLFKLGI